MPIHQPCWIHPEKWIQILWIRGPPSTLLIPCCPHSASSSVATSSFASSSSLLCSASLKTIWPCLVKVGLSPEGIWKSPASWDHPFYTLWTEPHLPAEPNGQLWKGGNLLLQCRWCWNNNSKKRQPQHGSHCAVLMALQWWQKWPLLSCRPMLLSKDIQEVLWKTKTIYMDTSHSPCLGWWLIFKSLWLSNKWSVRLWIETGKKYIYSHIPWVHLHSFILNSY